jgi:preprotein translocase subunit SecE
MSFKAKDIILSAMTGFVGLGAMYTQYFASISMRQYSTHMWVVLVLTAFVFLKFSGPGIDFIAYAKAARVEIRKVVWPGKQDVVSATVAVAIAVVIFSILVSFLDSLLAKMLAKIIG